MRDADATPTVRVSPMLRAGVGARKLILTIRRCYARFRGSYPRAEIPGYVFLEHTKNRLAIRKCHLHAWCGVIPCAYVLPDAFDHRRIRLCRRCAAAHRSGGLLLLQTVGLGSKPRIAYQVVSRPSLDWGPRATRMRVLHGDRQRSVGYIGTVVSCW